MLNAPHASVGRGVGSSWFLWQGLQPPFCPPLPLGRALRSPSSLQKDQCRLPVSSVAGAGGRGARVPAAGRDGGPAGTWPRAELPPPGHRAPPSPRAAVPALTPLFPFSLQQKTPRRAEPAHHYPTRRTLPARLTAQGLVATPGAAAPMPAAFLCRFGEEGGGKKGGGKTKPNPTRV